MSIPFGSDEPFLREADEAIRARQGGRLQPCSVRVRLDDPWLAEITLGEQDGSPIVERVEIKHDPYCGAYVDPAKPPGSPGSVVLSPTPKGGLPLRVLRSLTFGDALGVARDSLAEVSGEALSLHGFSRETLNEPRRPGKRGHPDRYYAEIAAAYVAAVERGSRRPVAEVAEELSRGKNALYTAAFVRDTLHIARSRGLLTRPRQGVSGGTLTARAKAVLREATS